MDKNQVFVTSDIDDDNLWRSELKLTDIHWINSEPDLNKEYKVRTRYRAPLVTTRLIKDGDNFSLQLDEQVRAVTPGQSAVIYDGDHVLGGGIVI
jgi:tRNA-specific 2-thiouridylase